MSEWNMFVLWKLTTLLVLATTGLCSQSGDHTSIGSDTTLDSVVPLQHKSIPRDGVHQRRYHRGQLPPSAEVRKKRDTTDSEWSVSLWEWLTGRDKPDSCVMVSVGGVIGGGALTGAFVGAGIGSIFTGPGTVVGAVVGGVVGIFGGISVGHKAGAAACDSDCGTHLNNIHCYS
ncbi:uncharacterized protein LOC129769522 [Toxorhynchites rutilus septentrionalis]|uniref:uncharacterized protein LOC129769522 n=1 Tax=Toxorhynchites rutilus septentrionalis TaxID=329112 RepID=UPI00247A881C|nr:uncharacterized protein LOC129769522 [Toxorhynchites rutilus septentrionalis]XP_055627825.1 uncharacterized protein LOC129769522 [Toxorhynchites rutilus septentrionalis]